MSITNIIKHSRETKTHSPRAFLELLTSRVSDLLVGGAHLGRVNLAAAELAFEGIEAYAVFDMLEIN